jgi:glyoxylase-like metal-dependent hydrolase (beta-lactamase superfamily II)
MQPPDEPDEFTILNLCTERVWYILSISNPSQNRIFYQEQTPMKHSLIRRALAVPAALLIVSLFVAASARAQAPVDDSKTVVKTNKITENFYTVDGRGGTIGVLVGPQGTFMVDTQFAPLTDRIVAAIKQISPNPIRFVVNTHVHPDHTGGNANMGKMGATILARDELRDRLINPAPGANGQPGTPAADVALPVITYENKITFHMDGETIDLIPIRKAHTDGDTMVYFHNADIIMTGDFYRSIGYPNIDRVNGGSLDGMIAGLGQIVALAGPNTKIIPGHGANVDRAAVMAHRDMIIGVGDQVAKLMKEGKTADEVVAAHPTADFDGKVLPAAPNGDRMADRFVGQLYAELKPGK